MDCTMQCIQSLGLFGALHRQYSILKPGFCQFHTNSYFTLTVCRLPDGGGERKREGNTEAGEQMGQIDTTSRHVTAD